jgi:hypothetical protein
MADKGVDANAPNNAGNGNARAPTLPARRPYPAINHPGTKTGIKGGLCDDWSGTASVDSMKVDGFYSAHPRKDEFLQVQLAAARNSATTNYLMHVHGK